jgi:hypothetical protein
MRKVKVDQGAIHCGDGRVDAYWSSISWRKGSYSLSKVINYRRRNGPKDVDRWFMAEEAGEERVALASTLQ